MPAAAPWLAASVSAAGESDAGDIEEEEAAVSGPAKTRKRKAVMARTEPMTSRGSSSGALLCCRLRRVLSFCSLSRSVEWLTQHAVR